MTPCALCSRSVDPEADLVWRKDGHDVVRCPSCRLVFRATLPRRDEIARLYDVDYFRDRADRPSRRGYEDYLADQPLHRANARRRLRLLAARGAREGRLLDVGCAAGFFVDEARRAGWDAVGLDVSAEMVEWAGSQLGVPVSRGRLDGPLDVDPDLDVVTMWDYIEHSAEPRTDLETAHALLGPGGLLALSTGDVGSVSARLTGSRWHLLTPEHHIFYFDLKTLPALLAQTGFEVLEARHRSSLYSVAHVLYKLEALAGVPPLRRAAARLRGSAVGSLAVPLNLYDIVTVVARRR